MASKDVEMVDVEDTKNKKDSKDETVVVPKTPEEIEAILLSDIESYIHLVDQTANNKEIRHLLRALRHTFARIRRKLNINILKKLVGKYFVGSDQLAELQGLVGECSDMEVESPVVVQPETTKTLSPEVEVYLRLLVAVYLIDSKQFEVARNALDKLVDRLGTWNRRTLDPLSAKVYFYFSRVYEKLGRLEEIRVKLLHLQRTVTLRHNFEGQVTILNLLLRNYLHYNLYDQADKLASKTEMKTEKANSNELARYHFYLGRINAVQLNYSEAHNNLLNALRKGPRDSACGFRSIVTKFLVIVQLLIGEIPERSTFRSKGIKESLKPYLQLTQTVRSGDLVTFRQCVKEFETVFKKDNTFSLIQRLHHNVIKTGLRKISSSYSRIYFKDICAKLSLEDAESIVAKAIKDGIIDGKINHEEGYLKSSENIDVYSTNEPEQAFSQRIEFCLQIHNEAVKAMRYPPDVFKKKAQVEADKLKDNEDTEIAESLEDDADD
eukprot:TRINITY_DN12171_c0_g1_i1.p1 TRINITY_DN12171_c0_g1~~TRINITY_DN12171_c0_g1_i1.p1  ORF type:complete len:494 (-),score=97.84 TRINITY_DN12171_c0_g1_i1:38-1519(-)